MGRFSTGERAYCEERASQQAQRLFHKASSVYPHRPAAVNLHQRGKGLGKKTCFFFLLLVFICFPLVDGAKGRNPLVRWSQSRTQKQQDLFRAYCSPDVLPRGSEQRSQQVGRRHPRNPQMIRHAIFFAFLLLFFVSFPPVHTHVLLYDAATNND